MDFLPLRLTPGVDLRDGIQAALRDHGTDAAFVVSGIGSLSTAAIRFANAPSAATMQGPFEILTLQGSISPDGSHLHVSIADANGRTYGGHVASGCIVYTTAEILLAPVSGYRLMREQDPATGHRELRIDRAPPRE